MTPPPPPLDDESIKIKASYLALAIFSSCFVLLRLGVNWANKKYFVLSDHLLLVGQILALIGTGYGYNTAFHGAGKHVYDPSVNFEAYMKSLWFAQVFNVFGMAVVKLSICAFLYMLNFSRTFRILIWVSFAFHVATNVIFPAIIFFGECNPIAKHWLPMLPGYCWEPLPRVVSGYVGAAANIATDLFYTSAPLVYTARVQLPKRTLWGVRAVFLFALVATGLSAVKLYEIRALNVSADPTFEGTNLGIFSNAEVFVGAFAASLPPLRKTFETLLSHVLPESVMGTTRKASHSYALPAYGSHLSSKNVKLKHELDDSSERGILPGDPDWKAGDSIVRTRHFSAAGEDGSVSKNTGWS